MNHKIVEVIWIDAWSDSAHVRQSRLDNMEPVPRRDVGYLRKKTKGKIVLVGGITEWSKVGEEEDDFNNEQVIPMGMVKEIKPLGVIGESSD